MAVTANTVYCYCNKKSTNWELTDCGLIEISYLYENKIMASYKELNIWVKSMELVSVVYEIMKHFPIDEKYGLVSQTKRAVVSLPSNIAEGLGRNYKKDTIQFLHIARGVII